MVEIMAAFGDAKVVIGLLGALAVGVILAGIGVRVGIKWLFGAAATASGGESSVTVNGRAWEKGMSIDAEDGDDW